MNLIRYQTPQPYTFSRVPHFSTLQNDVERFFDHSLFTSASRGSDGLTPTLDLYQDAEKLTLNAELPGLKREDFHLSLHEGTLTISGERRQEKSADEQGAVCNERFFGKFERTIALPFPVDVNRVSAVYQDGVLTVSLPKAEEAKPRQIEVQ